MNLSALRQEKRRLIAELRAIRAEIAAGPRPSPRAMLRQLLASLF